MAKKWTPARRKKFKATWAARRTAKKAPSAPVIAKTSIPLLSLAKRLEAEVVKRITTRGEFEDIDTLAATVIRAIRGS